MSEKDNEGFLPSHGAYENLLSYRKAEIVYDLTYGFCCRFLKPKDRTIDQMVQAARSGKQNILEGSRASGTSKETELKLTGIAPAWTNYCATIAILRTRKLRAWNKDSREASFVRRFGGNP